MVENGKLRWQRGECPFLGKGRPQSEETKNKIRDVLKANAEKNRQHYVDGAKEKTKAIAEAQRPQNWKIRWMMQNLRRE